MEGARNDIGVGLLSSILEQAGVSREERLDAWPGFPARSGSTTGRRFPRGAARRLAGVSREERLDAWPGFPARSGSTPQTDTEARGPNAHA